MLQKRGGRTYLSPMICPYDSPAWQLARSRPTNTALALYLIYVKSVLPHGWEGDNGCLSLCVIHSALELGGYGGKVTIYLRNGKGRGNVKWMVCPVLNKLTLYLSV